MNFKTPLILSLMLVATVAMPTFAAEKAISGNFSKDLTGYTLVAIGDDGSTMSTKITGKKFSITPKSSQVSLNLVGSDSAYYGPIVASRCVQRKGKSVCTKNLVVTGFRSGSNLGTVSVLASSGLVTIKKAAIYKKSLVTTRYVTADKNGKPAGAGTLGLTFAATSSRGVKVRVDASSPDQDVDGLPAAYDADDDGDGVLDNYDSTATTPAPAPTASSATFKIFSNFKLDIDRSINFNTGVTPTTAQIDSLLQETQSLAMEVKGTSTNTVELDCGTLGYCTLGGTGRSGNSKFPADFDADGDGLGTMSKGPTSDFQLQTGATTATIAAGDTFIQRVTDASSTTTEYNGMLNFIFYTTPALKTLTVGGTAYSVDYTLPVRKGSRQDCFQVPSSVTGEVTLDLVAWRPQRPGVTTAGEAAYVDLGNSNYAIDIPNAPCSSPSGGCSGNGPGNCGASTYSGTDTNLSYPATSGAQTIVDLRGDKDADPANTFSFSVNVSKCLQDRGISWNTGETVFIDLQARSNDGDNAAQKFCVTR